MIYLDNAATTAVDKQVLEAMLPYFSKDFGNASSIHQIGQNARTAIDSAREQVAKFLNCKPVEVVFTGSATESDNIAVLGIEKGHIITSSIEHPAILNACKALEKQGIEVSYLPVDKDGIVKIEDIEKAIKESTVLISIIYANNEIGVIQPITEIGRMLKRINESRENKIYFHTDAVQAVNYLICDVGELGVDMLTLSGHKIYGPKGVGVLYVRQGTRLSPIIFGGNQEYVLRPGTENTANIVGLGKAIEMVRENKQSNHKIKELQDKLINGIIKKIPNSTLNGSREHRLPNNANFSFRGAEGEALVIALDQQGIAASTGSACSSGSLEPSHVLLALGLSHLQAHGSLRLTLGRYTTEKEIDKVLEVLSEIIEKLRKISGYKS